MEQRILCPYCMGEITAGETSCPHCKRSYQGRNPLGTLPVGTLLNGRYTVGEMLSVDGEGVLYRGVENKGRFRVTIKEYLPITLAAERGKDLSLNPKQGSEVLFKTTRMDFADLYRVPCLGAIVWPAAALSCSQVQVGQCGAARHCQLYGCKRAAAQATASKASGKGS